MDTGGMDAGDEHRGRISVFMNPNEHREPSPVSIPPTT